MLVLLKAHAAALFSSEVREVMRRPYADTEEGRILAIGEGFTIEEDDDEVEADNTPVFYTLAPSGDLVTSPLYGAPAHILDQTGSKFFSIFGSNEFWRTIVGHERDILGKIGQHHGSEVAASLSGSS